MENERFRRRCLPHWDVPHGTYFVTTCLHGSIPAEGRLDIERYQSDLDRRRRPEGISEARWASDKWKLGFQRADEWLDLRPGVKHLEDPRLAKVVADALRHFAEVRYQLISFVIMPSHYHWVFRPLESWFRALPASNRTPRQQIIHSINRFTSGQCNEILGTSGQFWQHECYDHWVRDENELERIVDYVEGNPVKAGLVGTPAEWPFSTASAKTTELDV